MPKKTFTPEQIVAKLRQIEVLVSQGKTVPLACKDAGIVEQTFYRWRREYGGLQLEQAAGGLVPQKLFVAMGAIRRANATARPLRRTTKQPAAGTRQRPSTS